MMKLENITGQTQRAKEYFENKAVLMNGKNNDFSIVS